LPASRKQVLDDLSLKLRDMQLVLQATICGGLPLDPFDFLEDGALPSEAECLSTRYGSAPFHRASAWIWRTMFLDQIEIDGIDLGQWSCTVSLASFHPPDGASPNRASPGRWQVTIIRW